MRTTVLALLILTKTAFAAPYLTADPYTPQSDPNLNPVSFVITGIGANPISSTAYTQPSTGNIYLMYDLATLPNGTYSVTAQAVNVFGGTSPASNPPFNFTRGTPGQPSNLKIIQTLPL